MKELLVEIENWSRKQIVDSAKMSRNQLRRLHLFQWNSNFQILITCNILTNSSGNILGIFSCSLVIIGPNGRVDIASKFLIHAGHDLST